MRNTKKALEWIVGILNKLNIKFEIDGGLAAEMYGSGRELADIDINILGDEFDKLLPLVQNYIKFGPAWYEDEHWKIFMITLNYAGQNIDISPLGKIRFFDKHSKQWVDYPTDLSGTRMMSFMGMELPFVNEMKLMIYKQKLARGVDRKDVADMEHQLEKEWDIT